MALHNSKQYTDFKNVSIGRDTGDGVLRFGAQLSDSLSASDDLAIYWKGDSLKAWNGSAETDILAGGGGGVSTWDGLYDLDKTLTIDADTLTFSLTHATNDGLTLTGSAGSAGDVVKISNSGSGKDISGTADVWSITKAGVIVATALTMGDDESITLGDGSDATITWDGTASLLDIAGATNFEDNVTLEASATITQAGVAGSDVLTITAGDAVMSDGSLSVTDADNAETVTVINNTATTLGAAASAGVVEIE